MNRLLLQISEKRRGFFDPSTNQKNVEEMKNFLDTYDFPKLNQEALSRVRSTQVHEGKVVMKVSQPGMSGLTGFTAEFY